MATIYVDTDTNLDDITTRVASVDFLRMRYGATLTVDSNPQETPMGILAAIYVDDGKFLIDSSNVKEIAYSSGTGTLPTIGDVIDNDTQTGTAKVIKLDSGDATSGVMTVTVKTGAFDDGDGVSFGAWTATADTVVVGYMTVYFGDRTITPTGLGTVDFKGNSTASTMYEIGVGDGTDSQSFALPHNGNQWGMWVETGSGTGVYEKWAKMASADAFTNYTTGDLGRVFRNVEASGTLSVGTSINGGVIPVGARVKIPNLHIGTTSTVSPFTETLMSAYTGTQWIEISVNNSADIYIDGVNLSSFKLSIRAQNDAILQNTCFPSPYAYIFSNLIQAGIMKNIIICSHRNDSSGFSTNTQLFDRCDGTGIDGILANSYQDYAGRYAGYVVDSKNLTIKNSVFQKDHNYSKVSYGFRLDGCTSCTLEDSTITGGGFLIQNNSRYITLKNISYSDTMAKLSLSAGTAHVDFLRVSTGANNILVDTIDVISGAALSGGDIIKLSEASNIIIKNIGGINNKIDMEGIGDNFITTSGICSDILIRNVWVDNMQNTDLLIIDTNTKGLTFENCSTRYNSRVTPDASNVQIKGVHAASGDLNTTTGVEVDYAGVLSGTHFLDIFTSDTTGRLHLVFMPPNDETASFVQITGGSPTFRKDGDLLMRLTGDQITYEFNYTILGHTGFENTNFVVSGVNSATLDVEYDLDTGSGYSGTWQDATGANLSAETISASGFKIKIRITATEDNTTTLIRGLYLSTTTTLTDQENNFYTTPAEVNVTLTNLVAGSQVALLDSNGVLKSNIAVVGTSQNFDVTSLVDDVSLGYTFKVRKAGYEPIKITTTTEGTYELPISQVEVVDIAGLAIYNRGDDSTTSLLSIDYANKRVDIGDGIATAEDLFDYVSEQSITDDAMETDIIMRFDGRDILLLNSWLLKRTSVGDANSGIDANVTVDGDVLASPDDEVNGSVDIRARAVRNADGGGGITEEDFHTYLDTYSNKGEFAADALTLPQFIALKDE